MNLTRWTTCLVVNHKWVTVPYNDHDDSGKYLKCRRCGHEDHSSSGTIATGAPIGF